MEITYLPASDITPWIAFRTSAFFIEDYYGNHQLYPHVVPVTKEYVVLDQAIARAVIRKNITDQAKDTSSPDKITTVSDYLVINEQGIILQPRLLTLAGSDRAAILIALDSLQPSSTSFYKHTGTPESYLGYCLALDNYTVKSANEAEKIHIRFANGQVQELDLPQDTLVWCHTKPTDEIVLTYDFHKATINDQKSGEIPVVFGETGLVIDTRGRPFDLPQDSDLGRERLANWLSTIDTIWNLR